MLDDYKLKGQKTKIEAELEADIADKLSKMAQHMKLSSSEIVNTALKRFIASHHDFLPPGELSKAKRS